MRAKGKTNKNKMKMKKGFKKRESDENITYASVLVIPTNEGKVLPLHEIFCYSKDAKERLPVTSKILRESNNGRGSRLKIVVDGQEEDIVVITTSENLSELTERSCRSGRRQLRPKLNWNADANRQLVTPQSIERDSEITLNDNDGIQQEAAEETSPESSVVNGGTTKPDLDSSERKGKTEMATFEGPISISDALDSSQKTRDNVIPVLVAAALQAQGAIDPSQSSPPLMSPHDAKNDNVGAAKESLESLPAMVVKAASIDQLDPKAHNEEEISMLQIPHNVAIVNVIGMTQSFAVPLGPINSQNTNEAEQNPVVSKDVIEHDPGTSGRNDGYQSVIPEHMEVDVSIHNVELPSATDPSIIISANTVGIVEQAQIVPGSPLHRASKPPDKQLQPLEQPPGKGKSPLVSLTSLQHNSSDLGISSEDHSAPKKLKKSKHTEAVGNKLTPTPSLDAKVKVLEKQITIMQNEIRHLKSDNEVKDDIIERYKGIVHQSLQPPTASNILGTIADRNPAGGNIASASRSEPGRSHQTSGEALPVISQEIRDFLLSDDFIKHLTRKSDMPNMCHEIVTHLWDKETRHILYTNQPRNRPRSEIRKIRPLEVVLIRTVLAKVVKHPDMDEKKLDEKWMKHVTKWIS